MANLMDIARQSKLPYTATSPEPYCTVAITGGVGNQMFQYAAGRAVAVRTGASLAIDLTFYDKGRHRQYLLGDLPIQVNSTSGPTNRSIASLNRIRRILFRHPTFNEPHFHYSPEIESLTAPVILQGYFQSERYFSSIADAIRSELMPPEPTDGQSRSLAHEMRSTRSTVLHVRRGDYVTSAKISKIYAQCSPEYYATAMEQIPDSGPVYVFSDDIAWAKENLIEVKPLIFVDGQQRSALTDLSLMSLGYHHIIANSTFSWWGAWLAGPNKGLTIAPKQWFLDTSVMDQDLIPSHWLRI